MHRFPDLCTAECTASLGTRRCQSLMHVISGDSEDGTAGCHAQLSVALVVQHLKHVENGTRNRKDVELWINVVCTATYMLFCGKNRGNE